MNLINIENLCKSYIVERTLFEHASFYLEDGEKVGVIGINGTGKSTLLKMIAGLEEPDDGMITRANNLVIHYLPQNPQFDKGITVLEAVLKNNVTLENQWSIESEAKSMLNELGLSNYEAKVDILSGGQKKRLALAASILTPADLLILDEPTNHLDNVMSEWLETFLKKWKGALIMVTHDRYFLDSVSNRIVEIDKGHIYSYKTNYSGFLELKAQREDMELASERKRQSILRVELEWIKRGARARTTKQKARIQRYEDLKEKSAPVTDSVVQMSSVYTRMGRTTVELEHLYKSYDKTLISDFSYIFLKNDRVAFIGPNGCGKSTLLKMIIGKEQLDFGTVTLGQTIKVGYYSQEIQSTISQTDDEAAKLAYMDPNKRIIDYIRDTAEYVRTSDGLVSASQMLETFLFDARMQYSLIGKLSGGEKRRLNLLRVLMEAPNVLILDEPTNDLDIQTLTILEDYLDHFDGIVIIVSHDRYFLDRTVKRIFAFEENGYLRQYEGGWTDYYLTAKEQGRLFGTEQVFVSDTKESKRKDEKANEIQSNNSARVKPKKLKFTYQEQKDYDTIEDVIMELEEKSEELDNLIAKSATDFVRLNQLLTEKEEIEQKLEEKLDRWAYLMDLAEKIEMQK